MLCIPSSQLYSEQKKCIHSLQYQHLHVHVAAESLFEMSYDYQLSKVWQNFGDHVLTFNFFVVMATGSYSRGNLSGVDVVGRKVREIAGVDIVTSGNEES